MPNPITTDFRRFEFSQGSANKFWEIGVLDAEVTVRFGRIGTQGQNQVKCFADHTSANKHTEKLIRQKLAKGYIQVH